MKNKISLAFFTIFLFAFLSFIGYYLTTEGIVTTADVEAFYQGVIDRFKSF